MCPGAAREMGVSRGQSPQSSPLASGLYFVHWQLSLRCTSVYKVFTDPEMKIIVKTLQALDPLSLSGVGAYDALSNPDSTFFSGDHCHLKDPLIA